MEVRRILNELRFNANAQSSALGLSSDNAVVRAGMEAYERCAAAFRGDEYFVSKTQRDLGSDARSGTALHPTAHATAVQKPLPDATIIDWTSAWSLTYSAVRWIPMAFCYFGFPRDQSYTMAHSRGLAAGPTLAFCVLKGLYELIESVALATWENQTHFTPCVNLNSFKAPTFEDILAYHKAKNRDVWVLDLTLPVLPAFVFVAISYDPQTEHFVYGSAAHCRAEQGVRAALLECTQMLPNLLLDEKQRVGAMHVSQHLQARHHWDRQYDKDYYDAKSLIACSLQDLVDCLAEARIEVLVKDLTRAQVPIHVARVIFSTNEQRISLENTL